ncbi:hypothetical protein GGP88_003018 [Salinibacter ruber]|nr:hypothetical protein [Salinibacter ruber]
MAYPLCPPGAYPPGKSPACFRPASLRAALRAWRIFLVPVSFLFPVCLQSCRGPAAKVRRVGFRTYVSNAASMRALCRSCSPYLLQGPFPGARLLQSRNLRVPDFARSRVALGGRRALCARRRPAPGALPRPPSCFPNHLAGLLAGLDAFRSCCVAGMRDRGATGSLPDSFAFGTRLRTLGHLLVPLRATGFNCEKPSAENLRRT